MVILILVIFSIVGFSICAADNEQSPKTDQAAAAGPVSEGDETIGNSDEFVAGGPMPPFAESPLLSSPGGARADSVLAPASGASTLEVSSIFGFAIAPFACFFFFS